MDRWIDGQIDRWIDGQVTCVCTYFICSWFVCPSLSVLVYISPLYGCPSTNISATIIIMQYNIHGLELMKECVIQLTVINLACLTHAIPADYSRGRYSTNQTTYIVVPDQVLCTRYFVLQKYRTQFVYDYTRTVRQLTGLTGQNMEVLNQPYSGQ